MKIVTTQMPLHSTSLDDLGVKSFSEPKSLTDADQLNRDLKVFPEEFSEMLCHRKDVDPLAVEMNDYTLELPGDDCSVVTESHVTVSFDDPLEMCFSEVGTDLDNVIQSYGDPSGGELEHSVSKECSREADGSAIRDIRVDEGVCSNDKNLLEDNADGQKCIVEDSIAAKDTQYGLENVKMEVEWHVPVGLKSMVDEASKKDFNGCQSRVLVHRIESENESTYLVSCDSKDKFVGTFVSEDAYAEVLPSITSVENKCITKPCILHQDSIAEIWDATTDKLSSSAPEGTIKETADDCTVGTSDMKIEQGQEAKKNHFLPEENNNELERPSNVNHSQIADASQTPEQQNLGSDHLTSSARIQRDYLESSFASVGPYTNSIAYSGSVAYSGSLSHRSDASTVSTRSFAFPVLQNEWNFSPVRMRKASRGHLGRRRGWMNGLFCCKF